MKRKRFTRPTREKNIEDKSRDVAEANCGRLIKTVALGWPGFPDRMALFPKCDVSFFVEFKRGNEQPTALQIEWHGILRASGQDVVVCRSVEEFRDAMRVRGVR